MSREPVTNREYERWSRSFALWGTATALVSIAAVAAAIYVPGWFEMRPVDGILSSPGYWLAGLPIVVHVPMFWLGIRRNVLHGDRDYSDAAAQAWATAFTWGLAGKSGATFGAALSVLSGSLWVAYVGAAIGLLCAGGVFRVRASWRENHQPRLPAGLPGDR
jgi:O-antigen/teichoic acid export membrane protein